MADILCIAKKLRTAVRNKTGTSFTRDEVLELLKGGIVSSVYRLEEKQEMEALCPANDPKTGPINSETAGSGSETSKGPRSGASVGMTNEQERRGVSQRGFGVVTNETDPNPSRQKKLSIASQSGTST